MTKDPIISIITPSYNQVKFIEETITSVLNQDYPNLEYIIIDGGSTDGSVDIIRKYEDKLAYYVSEPDKGQTDAINKGLRKATGDILAYLNSDDLYEPNTIQTIVNYFAQSPEIKMIYGDVIQINEQGLELKRVNPGELNFYKLLSGRFYLPQPTVFFKREVLNNIGFFDEDLHLAMDLDYWIRIVTSKYYTKQNLKYVNNILADVRIYPNAKSISLKHKYLDEKLKILNKLYSEPSFSKYLISKRNQLYGEVYFDSGITYLNICNLIDASKCFITSLLLYPKCFVEPAFLKSIVPAIFRKIRKFLNI